jgi:hypothetical protein
MSSFAFTLPSPVNQQLFKFQNIYVLPGQYTYSQHATSTKSGLVMQLHITLPEETPAYRPPLFGSFADLGSAPSSDDIDAVRREMWGEGWAEDM